MVTAKAFVYVPQSWLLGILSSTIAATFTHYFQQEYVRRLENEHRELLEKLEKKALEDENYPRNFKEPNKDIGLEVILRYYLENLCAKTAGD